jgi:hypothetical protein
METQVRTPQMVFMQPQRLIVPLFQRPYVWNQENQWEPLWDDVVRVAERQLSLPQGKPPFAHFLGAVVLQQVPNQVGSLQERTIIDGQQRLTTLQLLFHALHTQLDAVGATQPARRLEALVANAEPFVEQPEDRFKVWPTNRDRTAFNCVMGASAPIGYDALEHSGARLVEAHRFFAKRAEEWLNKNGPDDVGVRASAIERTVRELLQLVVIDLTTDENAQEIFETLNARGTPLTAADLIKNFIFQRLLESGANVEDAYERNWKEFETGFWETEVNFGRIRYSRSSIFLNHWLIAKTGEEIVAREVFSRFKQYADFEVALPMVDLLQQLHRPAAIYREFVTAGATHIGPVDRLALFAYRTGSLESEVFKPLVLWLLDPEQPPLEEAQFRKSLEVVESWLVRRMLVRASTNSYAQIAAELITELRKTDRARAGDTIEGFLHNQSVASRYWPDDIELRRELSLLMAYVRLRRGRLRMILEAIEDYRRGWKGNEEGLGGERVTRGRYAIEHIMPRKWQAHWPLSAGTSSESGREQLIHTLGNLTLLTSRLNAKVSNGPWSVKRVALKDHDVLKLNMDLLDVAGSAWSEDDMRARTERLVDMVIKIWPVPEGHRSNFATGIDRPRRRIEVSDLISSGLLDAGATLYARRKRQSHRTATVLADGRIDVDGVAYASPSAAAGAISGGSENGWWFFLVSPDSKRSLTDVWRDYVDQTSIDVDEGDMPEEEDE